MADGKPTAVRQALAALYEVVIARPALRPLIREKITGIDLEAFNPETMRPLIEKDIRKLLKVID